MKFRLLVTLAALITSSSLTSLASTPFDVNSVNLRINSGNQTAISLQNTTATQKVEDLKKAFALLASTKAKFAELLRQIAANPEKFAKNGSLKEINQKIAAIQKKLNESTSKLLKIHQSIDPSQRPTVPAWVTAKITIPAQNSPQTSSTAGSGPAAKAMNVSGKVTSKSPGFKSWMANGVKIAHDWKFPDITNMYGEKITRENFLKAIMYIESGGVHQRSNGSIVTSSCGALGFMQLMPRTAQGLGVNPRDPQQNIAGGAKYFKTVFNGGKVGSKTGMEKLIMAACAYNCGPYSKRLDQSWSSFVKDTRAPKETRRYGLKLKMCLGLKLTAEEISVARQLKMTGNKNIDQYARDCYVYSKGIGM